MLPASSKQGLGESTERLRRALGQAFASHPDLLHPEVLKASQALDEEIVRWTKESQEQQKTNKQSPRVEPG